MKLITFAVPSYNSQDYMRRCIDTLLTGGEEVEIIIVNDGSKDNTGAIADEYAAKYPTIVVPVHQENGGHGSGVNAGMERAKGLYYKVVDSDDWLNEEALQEVLTTIRSHVEKGEGADLYIANFVYEHVSDGTSHVSHYRKKMPVGRFFGWDEVKPFKQWEMLLMHSLIYRTEALRQSGICLPKHTFYVDNIFSYQPLPYMKKLYYIDVDLYRYFIGRSDQSVNMDNMTKRYEQQLRVMQIMTDAYTYDEIKGMEKGLSKYMFHALGAIMVNTVFFTSAGKNDRKERKEKLKALWKHIKDTDKKLYKKLRYRSLPVTTSWLPFGMKGVVSTAGYKFLCKFVKLGQ
jgi:glycosyltransferase involved in cell wall biosynthesis